MFLAEEAISKGLRGKISEYEIDILPDIDPDFELGEIYCSIYNITTCDLIRQIIRRKFYRHPKKCEIYAFNEIGITPQIRVLSPISQEHADKVVLDLVKEWPLPNNRIDFYRKRDNLI